MPCCSSRWTSNDRRRSRKACPRSARRWRSVRGKAAREAVHPRVAEAAQGAVPRLPRAGHDRVPARPARVLALPAIRPGRDALHRPSLPADKAVKAADYLADKRADKGKADSKTTTHRQLVSELLSRGLSKPEAEAAIAKYDDACRAERPHKECEEIVYDAIRASKQHRRKLEDFAAKIADNGLPPDARLYVVGVEDAPASAVRPPPKDVA